MIISRKHAHNMAKLLYRTTTKHIIAITVRFSPITSYPLVETRAICLYYHTSISKNRCDIICISRHVNESSPAGFA